MRPGLYSNEKKFVIPFVVLSTGFFTLGAAFAHYVAFPWAMQFFASFESANMTFMPRIAPVFSMYVKMILAMGLVFEMPTLVFFLAKVGIATPGWLIRKFKYALLAIFIVAAILTPGTDPVSQFMMAGPMVGPLPPQHRNCLGSSAEAPRRIARPCGMWVRTSASPDCSLTSAHPGP